MKLLQKEFQSNVDQCGLHTFKQIKCTDKAALYQRIRKDGTTHSWESFRIKIVRAGAKLPNGTVVAEDYVQYPGKSAFGKYAYSCTTLGSAERHFDEIVQLQLENDSEKVVDEDDGENKVTVKVEGSKGKRGRKAIDRKSIKMPIKGEKFDLKGFHLLNPDVSIGFLYQHLKGLLNIDIKIVDTVSGGRGKPRLVYGMI